MYSVHLALLPSRASVHRELQKVTMLHNNSQNCKPSMVHVHQKTLGLCQGGALSRHSISTARSENIFSETIIWRVFPNVSYFLEEETSKRKSLCSSAGFKPKCEQMKLVSSSILSPFLRPVCSTFQFYLTWLTTNDPVEVRNRMLRCRPYVLRSTFGIPKCN
ncbi:uncharacterized protein ACOB8E_002640 isoform 3-T3 [Sarcophilus harrisii]